MNFTRIIKSLYRRFIRNNVCSHKGHKYEYFNAGFKRKCKKCGKYEAMMINSCTAKAHWVDLSIDEIDFLQIKNKLNQIFKR